MAIPSFTGHIHISLFRFQRAIRPTYQLAPIYGIPNPDTDTWMGLDDPFCSQGKGCLISNKAQNLAVFVLLSKKIPNMGNGWRKNKKNLE
jgi:hypothetical protein